MSARTSATRYARALLDVAIKEGDPQQAERDLALFAGLLAEHKDLREVLTNPVVGASAKRAVTGALVTRLGFTGPVAKLLLMLADRDRVGLLPMLLTVYRDRLLDHQKVVRADVTTATPLSDDRAAQLRAHLSAVTGRTVTMTTHVDPSLIGGVIARIGSTVYDGSIATQLSKMRDTFLEQH